MSRSRNVFILGRPIASLRKMVTRHSCLVIEKGSASCEGFQCLELHAALKDKKFLDLASDGKRIYGVEKVYNLFRILAFEGMKIDE